MNSTNLRLRIVFACGLALAPTLVVADPFTFDDINFWVGSGANRAAVVIDWTENATQPAALAWGYRWDGNASGRDMLTAIVATDDRLFAKLGNTSANPVRLYGLGYDADDDGDFGACSEIECTEFDDSGFAYSGEIFVAATATDDGDEYREGWATGTGFWHYGIPATPGTNPYDGGNWSDIPVGMATRQLTNGDWDSWAFQLSTTPPFTSFAENPVAAASPYPPGDFNRDTVVDVMDYELWKSEFGSTSDLEIDASGNGVVDAADYTIWRNNFSTGSGHAAALRIGVPEPSTLGLALCSLWQWFIPKRKEKLSCNDNYGWRSPYL